MARPVSSKISPITRAPTVQEFRKPKLVPIELSVPDVQDEKYIIPLDGQWMPSSDPTQIGKNFSILTNLRYVDNHPESVRGMNKINTTAINGTSNPRSVFHFRKSQPPETHILVQCYGTTGTASTVFDSTFAIPYAGTSGTAGTSGVFSSAVWTDSTAGTGGAQQRGQFSDAPNGQLAYCNGIDNCLWGGAEIQCGAFIHSGAAGNGGTSGTASTFSYDYSDRMINLKTDAENIVTLTKGTDGNTNLQIGSVRLLQGVKLYVQTANSSSGTGGGTSGTAIVRYWDGSAEQGLTITDNTSIGNVRLAQTGTITFSSTVDIAKLRYLEGRLLYFYHLIFTGLATNTALYYATLNAPFQNLYDLWDGTPRRIAAYYKFTTVYTDSALNVRNDEYVESDTDTSTYSDLSSLAAFSEPNNCLEIGFTERQTGIFFDLPDGHVNTTASTAASVDYWNGKQYLTVGTITDGTSENSKSFAKSGVITWNNTSLSSELKKSINNGYPLYFYRIRFNQALSSTVRLYYVAGMSATKKITGYSFPVHANDRLMLGCNNYERKNSFLISAKSSPDVFNGIDSYEVDFGDDKPLTCGSGIFAQYSSNLFNMVLVFKATETWSLSWIEQIDGTIWERFRISPYIGCPAPQTLRVASVGFDNDINKTKLVAIWRGNNGIYMSNGQSPLEISEDIKDVFDQTKTTHVNLSMIANEYSFIDHYLMEYHWLWASGTNVTLDKEYVLDLRRWGWEEIDRATGNRLQCGVSVTDIDGNHYAYGFIDPGYMIRLEVGTTFNGSDITSTMQVGDQLPIPQDIFAQTSIERVNLIAVAKSTDTTITLTHNIDGGTAGTSYSLSDADTTHRYANVIKDIFSTLGVFHNFKLVKVTNAENKGFEPLYLAVLYRKERDHTK